MQQFREVSRTRTIYSAETHTSDFILYTFWNGKPVQFFQERCCVVTTGCQENKSCSKVLNFLERLDDRIRCTHKETVAVVEPWKDVGSNKSLGCVFSEKPADWTNAFKLEISSLADFYEVCLSLVFKPVLNSVTFDNCGRFWKCAKHKIMYGSSSSHTQKGSMFFRPSPPDILLGFLDCKQKKSFPDTECKVRQQFFTDTCDSDWQTGLVWKDVVVVFMCVCILWVFFFFWGGGGVL